MTSGQLETGNGPRLSTNGQRFSSRDKLFILLCILIASSCIVVVSRYFSTAFPEASIEFRHDRNSSRAIAEKVLAARGVKVSGMKHAVRFSADQQARIFLERTLGLEQTRQLLRDEVRVWSWHHRWFRPLVEEELSVDVAPTGEVIGYQHKIPEDRPIAGTAPPVPFLRSIGARVDDLNLVSTSERKLPHRVQRIYTFESRRVHPAGASYRHIVTIDGSVVTGYSQRVKVPDAWLRSYREMRSRNAAAGAVDTIFMGATMLAAVVVFIARLRRGNIPIRFLLALAAASVILIGGVAVNEIPGQLAWYDTTTSYPAFLGQMIFFAAIQSIGTAMMLIVICGAGEVLYRERLPQHLAIPRLWTRQSLTSKRVFLSLILGYALVPAFMAYQTVFYLVAHRFGAWSPAEVPYDDMLNTAVPWFSVLFAGFFPAFSEEFLSRAFSIPFLQRLVRSRWFAIILAGFVWGFGHATYPNQPFWIRGVEVGIAGIVAGLLMDRFGLLPLLIWHYTIDAVYTATLLFGSGNTYYVVSAAVASLIFAVPLIASVALYVKNKGFVADDELTNAAMPVAPLEPAVTTSDADAFPEPEGAPPSSVTTMVVAPRRVLLCAILVIVACVAVAVKPPSPQDSVDYRITKERAKQIANWHVQKPFDYVIALPVEGFRSWDPNSSREDGGAPSNFDSVAATHLIRAGLTVAELTDIFRTRIETGTWMVRFFTPMQKEEIFVEVDPRSEKVVGYHKYQDEAKPGAALPQPVALRIAQEAFPLYGLEVRDFELREALTYAQPRRRDWLFHFNERKSLVPEGFRRVTVRVAGADVTQFSKTIDIPENVYREASKETLLNVVLQVLRIVGGVAIMAIIIAGLVIAGRKGSLPWRPALRWTLLLAVVPIGIFFARYESMLFGYSTSVEWATFTVTLLTGFVTEVGVQIGLLFLALTALAAVVPNAFNVVRPEGRAAFGKSAVIAALTAVSIVTIADIATKYVARAFPAAASVDINAPAEAAMRFPALVQLGSGITLAIVASAAAALYAFALRRHTAPITIVALFCVLLDPGVTPAQAPLMLAGALVLALLVWIIGRHVLGSNPLAWPLFILLAGTLDTAGMLLRNHRPDLQANSIALFVLVAITLLWAWRGRARVV